MSGVYTGNSLSHLQIPLLCQTFKQSVCVVSKHKEKWGTMREGFMGEVLTYYHKDSGLVQ